MRERLNLLRDDLGLTRLIVYTLANGYDERTSSLHTCTDHNSNPRPLPYSNQ